ncbi:MAG: hypothetical protein ACRCX2_38805 [Paraclostridium sp.]
MDNMTIIVCDYCDNDFAIETILAKDMDNVSCPYCMRKNRLKAYPFVDNSKPTIQFTPNDFTDDNGNPISLGTPMGHTIIDEVLPENDPDFKGIIIRSKE